MFAIIGHLGYLKGYFMTKTEYRAQLKAERSAARVEKLALIPNPDYRAKLSHHEIYAGVKKQPRFISPT